MAEGDQTFDGQNLEVSGNPMRRSPGNARKLPAFLNGDALKESWPAWRAPAVLFVKLNRFIALETFRKLYVSKVKEPFICHFFFHRSPRCLEGIIWMFCGLARSIDSRVS